MHGRPTGWSWRLTGTLALVLALGWLIYWPGLAGGFLFDDYSNLKLLGQYGPVDDWQTFWLYILSGFSGPTGRPLAYLSFLVDANHWPADPWPFKRTNVLIHLAAGLLLFGLLRSLLRALDYAPRAAAAAALLAMALWLLHPFWVSTTLYVVQRMAELAALFSIAGLWLWVELRRRRAPRLDATWIVGGTLAVGGFGLLAALSKENGALLPALVVVLEVTVLAAMDRGRALFPTQAFRVFRWLLLGVPVGLLALYVSSRLPALFSGDPGSRDFTPFERLLTQGRIVWDYVFHIALPRPYSGGLFNDGIVVSTGLFSPWTTALAWLAWLAVGVGAWRTRRRFPLLAAAVLFFLVGHSLESTFLQLELYFEHRSYLPAALLGLPLAAWWLTRAWIPADLRRVIPVAAVAAVAAMTAVRAELWSSPFLQALKWAQVNRDSPRSQHYLAGFWWETGNVTEAARLNDRAIALDPDGLPWVITRVMYECRADGDPERALSEVEGAIDRTRRFDAVATYQTEKLLDFLIDGSCGPLSRTDNLLALLDRVANLAERTGAGRLKELVLHRRALIRLRSAQPDAAFTNLRALVQTAGRPGVQLNAAAALASRDYYERALQILDLHLPEQNGGRTFRVERLRDWYLANIHYYDRERARLRAAIAADYAAQQASGPSNTRPGPE